MSMLLFNLEVAAASMDAAARELLSASPEQLVQAEESLEAILAGSDHLRRVLAEGAPEPQPKKKAKRRRRAVVVEEDDEESDDSAADAPAPPRTAPGRTAAARAKRKLEEAAEE